MNIRILERTSNCMALHQNALPVSDVEVESVLKVVNVFTDFIQNNFRLNHISTKFTSDVCCGRK